MANPTAILGALSGALGLAVRVSDLPSGNIRVSVLGIPFYDGDRRERRLARRAAVAAETHAVHCAKRDLRKALQ